MGNLRLDAVEVQSFFRGVMTGARYLPLEPPVKPRRSSFLIGRARDVDAPVGADMVAEAAFALVSIDAGIPCISTTPQMRGEVIFRDRTVALASYVTQMGLRFAAPAEARVRIACGASEFFVAATSRPRVLPAPALRWRRAEHGYTLATVVALLAFLAVIFALPPDPHAISGDLSSRSARFPPGLVIPLQPPPIPARSSAAAPGVAAPAGGGSPAARADSPKGRAAHPRFTAPTASGVATQDPRRAGIVGIWRSLGGGTWDALLSRETAIDDASALLAGLQTPDLADGYRGGGLTVGPGGPSFGPGGHTVGIGVLRTVGVDPSRYGPGPYGGDAGRLKGRSVTTPPDVKPGPLAVRGALDRAIVRRVIRQHINEVKYCYERELVKDPALGGRVSVQFTVAGPGRVMAALVASSTVANVAVESCIVQAVRRWEFPRPEGGGIVSVSYPFVLVPASP